MASPITHREESLKLTADGLASLYTLTFKDNSTVIRFCNTETITWRGDEYEGIACQLTGESYAASEEENRPKLSVLNPAGVFNQPAMDGFLEMAILVRKRVLRSHLEGNVNLFQQRMWYVSRVLDVIADQALTLELRNMTEGPNHQIPARMFIPPEFPTVSL